MVKFILIKSPDEWATTKQACRDELVVYLFFFSPIYTIYIYIYSQTLQYFQQTYRTYQLQLHQQHEVLFRQAQ